MGVKKEDQEVVDPAISGSPVEDNPLPDEDILRDEETVPRELPPAPSGATVTISGRQFSNVDPALAEAISLREQDQLRAIGAQSNELGELRKLKESVLTRERARAPEQQSVDYSEILYSDPNRFVEEIEQRVEKNVTSKYLQAERIKEEKENFWKSLFAENPVFAKKERVVRNLVSAIGPKYAHLDNTKAVRDMIASEVMANIVELNQGYGDGHRANPKTFVEGGSEAAPVEKLKKEEPRLTTSQILKRNRALKRRALLENR